MDGNDERMELGDVALAMVRVEAWSAYIKGGGGRSPNGESYVANDGDARLQSFRAKVP
jgi:hypothetical protein